MKEYYRLSKIFFRIGAFTIGGGYAMVPIIEEEIVHKNGWIDSDEFMDLLAMAQSLPGPLAVNMSTFVGYKLHGFKGGVTAFLSTLMPSFLIILLVANFMLNFADNIYLQKVFNGIRPAVAGLIFSAVLKLQKNVPRTKFSFLIVLSAVVLIALLGVNPVVIIVGAGLLGYFIYPKIGGRHDID